MKIEKLPSGSYRVRKMINGKKHSLTFDHRPTQKEINDEVSKRSNCVNGKTLFQDACASYVDARTNTLSPSTIKEYHGTMRRLSEAFMALEIDSITTTDVQKEINRLAIDRSPKTVRNYHGFIAAVLGEFRPEMVLHTTLPQKDNKSAYIPTDEDIKAILNEAKGTMMELPILLACASMRRGEICALSMDDIDFTKDKIYISKDMVLDENKNWIIKQPKTPESVRDIVVPRYIIDIIKERGLYTGHPNSISKWMNRTQDKLNMPHFSIHKCRHFFASQAHANGIPDADIMKAGGWKTDYVMKSVYRHSLTADNSAATNAVFSNLL